MQDQDTFDEVAAGEKHRPWVGVLLSFLVSGAGQFQAGLKARGVAWFLVLTILHLGVLFLASLPLNWPFLLQWGPLALWLVLYFWMLADAHRPVRKPKFRSWLLVFALAGLIPFAKKAAFSMVVPAFTVTSGAMAPTLRGKLRRPDQTTIAGTGDYIVAQRFAYWFSKPKRGDIVVFRSKGIEGMRGDYDVKRVVGLPGETISVKAGKLFKNGSLISEPIVLARIQYVYPTFTNPPYGAKHLRNENDDFRVPEGHYFVLGDNSAHSSDSRYWGPVPEANIVGKVTKIFLPPSRVSVPE